MKSFQFCCLVVVFCVLLFHKGEGRGLPRRVGGGGAGGRGNPTWLIILIIITIITIIILYFYNGSKSEETTQLSREVRHEAIIKNISSRKLALMGSAALLCLEICILVGVLFAPTPTNSDLYTATKCYNPEGSKVKGTWFWPKGKAACRQIEDFSNDDTLAMNMTEDNVVFAFQMPLPKNESNLGFTRWQQNLVGVLMADFMYQEENVLKADGMYQEDNLMGPRVALMFHASLAFRNKGDPQNEWKELSQSIEFRSLDCIITENKVKGHHYKWCHALPLFKLGYLHHDFYLLNIRIPTVYMDENNQVHENNREIANLTNLILSGIHTNGDFTKVWISLKTVFFFIILMELLFLLHQLRLLTRPLDLLEKMLISLGLGGFLLNLPVEWLTLFFDIPWLILFNDMKEDVFYTTLITFCLIFAREYKVIDEKTGESTIMDYWKSLSATLLGCLCLFVLNMIERGFQLQNPFSIWIWANLWFGFRLEFIGIILLFCLGVFIWICSVHMIQFQVKEKLAKVVNLVTVVTGIWAFFGQVEMDVIRTGKNSSNYFQLKYHSGFVTGVYGMWNIYICSLLFLYTPIHYGGCTHSL